MERIERMVLEYEKKIATHLEDEYASNTTRADKFADRVAAFGGSWSFITVFGILLVLWMTINSLQFTKVLHFDEQPFILLNLILSFIAAFQAPIIMMSQNRQAARDKHESLIDYAINYKAQQEVDDMQGHLHRLESGFATFEKEVKEDLAQIKRILQNKQSEKDIEK